MVAIETHTHEANIQSFFNCSYAFCFRMHSTQLSLTAIQIFLENLAKQRKKRKLQSNCVETNAKLNSLKYISQMYT